MMATSYVSVRETRTQFEVADVLREYGESYKAQHPVTPQQARVMGAMIACRTAQLGGHVQLCQDCGAVQIAYNSCRDRHCPKCGKFKKAQWVEKQSPLLLPIPYFHLVFTTDHAINPLVPDNQRAIYHLLFQSAADSIKQFAKTELHAEVGLTAVLHTWSQRLNPHVHLHCIVTGGGLSLDGSRWVRAKPNYLFDIVALSAYFRDRFCAGLAKLSEQADFNLPPEFDLMAVLAQMQAKCWEVFIKAFKGPEVVYDYLSRYVNQVAISNYRITDISQGQVSFSYHDNLDEGQQKTMTLSAHQFIARFLWHVLPDRFVRIRYYGLHHSQARKRKLPRCRALLGLTRALPEVAPLCLVTWLERVVGVDIHRCPFCGAEGRLTRWGEVADLPWAWLFLKMFVGLWLTPQVTMTA
jgi:hypothetical protein